MGNGQVQISVEKIYHSEITLQKFLYIIVCNFSKWIFLVIASSGQESRDAIRSQGQDFPSLQQHIKTFMVVQYSPVGFEAAISMPYSSTLVSSGLIDDRGGELTGEVTGYLLDSSKRPSDTSLSSNVDHSKMHFLSSQGPVTGSLSMRAIVVDHESNKGTDDI